MALSVRRQGDVHILSLSGDITLGGHMVARPVNLKGEPLSDISNTLRELLLSGHSQIVLDLSQVGFVDSAGLGELVACKKRTAEAGGDLKLLRPRSRVRELLELTHLTKIFEIFAGEAEALQAFTSH